jgi:hypothetical protein
LLTKIDAERQALARTVLPKSPVGRGRAVSDESVDCAPARR